MDFPWVPTCKIWPTTNTVEVLPNVEISGEPRRVMKDRLEEHHAGVIAIIGELMDETVRDVSNHRHHHHPTGPSDRRLTPALASQRGGRRSSSRRSWEMS